MWNLKSLLCFFTPVYLMSFFFVLSGQHFLVVWAGVELNLLAFIGLIKSAGQGRLEVNVMKYFLAQALGSVGMMLSFMVLSLSVTQSASTLLTMSIILKLGIFPFHTWFISFVSSSTGWELWTVSIPQKLIPLWILISFPPTGFLTNLTIIGSTFLALAGAMTNTRMSLVLGYSSLFNTSWMLIVIAHLDTLTIVFGCYATSLGVVLWSLEGESSSNYQESSSTLSPWHLKTCQFIGFLNLGGMPPLFNLWNKAATLSILMKTESMILVMLFLIASVGFMYIYLTLWFKNSMNLGTKTAGWDPSSNETLSAYLLVSTSALFFLF